VGLIDDEAFARQLVQHEFESRKSGRRVVRSALARKGVSPDVAASVLDELGGADEARALELATARAARLRALDPPVAFSRLSSLLIRRGHDPATARRVARRALEIEGSED
jgi:regulatory protein